MNCCARARVRRVGRAAGWLSPAAAGALVVLTPKCPMCLAGYLALATGVGFSVGAAETVRTALLVLLGASLLWPGWLVAGRVRKRLRGGEPQAPETKIPRNRKQPAREGR